MRHLSLLTIVIALSLVFTTKVYSQSDSVRWMLTSNANVEVFGNLAAGDETFSNMVVRSYNGGICQKSAPNSAGTWVAETGENISRYLQFAVSPAANYNFTVSTVKFYIGWAGTTSHMFANVYYSTDPTFSSRTKLGSTITLQNAVGVLTSFPLNVLVNDGTTFYVRIYPWDDAAATGKNCGLYDVGIYGSAASTVSSSISATPSFLSFGDVHINTSSVKTYALSGSNLNPTSGSIAISAPTGYEVSTISESGYTSSLTVPYSGGSLSATTIYVKFSPTTISSYSGLISNAGGGATTQNVSVTGNGVAAGVILGIFVSTIGSDSNPGTFDLPYATISKALSVALVGDTIFVRGGTYSLNTTIGITSSGTGNSSRRYLFAYGSERPILNFSTQAFGSVGVDVSGSYWHIKGLDIYKAGDNGMHITGSNNIIEFCSFHENNDSGLQLDGGASNNKVINCDSFFNADPTDYGDADGFACKMAVGSGNYFKYCRSWLNVDDGWDGYLRGANDVSTTIDSCWTWRNGYFKDGTDAGALANGNGFKMGGSDDKTLMHNVVLKDCLSFDNKSKGFDQNNNKGSMALYNCTGYRNSGNNYSVASALNTGKTLILTNCAELGNKVSLGTFAIQTTNSWMSPFVVDASDFISLDTTGISGPRKSDGSLPDVNFMHLAAGSDLIDAGTIIDLPYNGSAPDLGCFESPGTVTTYTITSSASANGSIVPSGVTTVISGGSQSYTIAPAPGYHVLDVLVDGISVSALSFYNFALVSANHTISASFALSVPAIPEATAATNIDTMSFIAHWNASVGASSYRLDVASDSLFNILINGYIDLEVTGTSWVITGLASDTFYYYRVRATNTAGTSGNSNTISVRTSNQLEILLTESAGWSLVSVPLNQADYTASAVFVGKFGSIFGYDGVLGRYVEALTLDLGKGYWVYYTSGTSVTIRGTTIGSLSVPCAAGWNLLGSRSVPILASALQVNTGEIFGSVFRYNTTSGSYEETLVLNPGEAIWIYVTQPCILTLP